MALQQVSIPLQCKIEGEETHQSLLALGFMPNPYCIHPQRHLLSLGPHAQDLIPQSELLLLGDTNPFTKTMQCVQRNCLRSKRSVSKQANSTHSHLHAPEAVSSTPPGKLPAPDTWSGAPSWSQHPPPR